MNRKIRAFCAVMLSALTLCGPAVLSGCNDFRFNPVGEWKNTKTLVNGKEVETFYGDNSKNFETCFVFRHNGTAYMTLNGKAVDKVQFTYTYDDETVVLDGGYEGMESHMEYKVKDNGNTLEYNPYEGTVYEYKRK